MAQRFPILRRARLVLWLLMLCGYLMTTTSAQAQFVEYKLTASDGDPNDRFGESAAIDGTTAIIGAFRDDDAGTDAGAVYVFDFNNGSWTQTSKLTPGNGIITPGFFDNGLFGSVADIHNDVIVVGATDSRENGIKTGAAYVFEKNTDGKWLQMKKFVPSDGAADDKFGSSVSTNGEFAFVGSLDHDPSNMVNAGAVYVYQKQIVGSDITWELFQKLTPSDAQAGDSFGWSVALDGTRAVIGARDVDDRGQNAGAVYIYEYNGSEWQQVTKLYAADARVEDSFGEVVAIDGDQIIVGARDVDVKGEESGAAYVLERQDNGSWLQTAKLLASDGESLDRFGNSVAIEGDFAVVSTRIDNDFSGAIYLFQRVGDSWIETSKITPTGLEAGDLFGQAVDISGTLIISGTKGDDAKGVDAGAAHIFDLASTDRAALIALYNATNGPNWSRKTNWLSNQALDNWFGVNTDGDGRVTEIDLSNNNLNGELPAALGALPALRRITLRDNNLRGVIPGEMGELTNLEILNLGLNDLVAPLPAGLGDLNDLRTLILDGNDFTGTIPAYLAQMPALETLLLNNNDFSGAVPDAFEGTTLNVLRLESNQLVDLPALPPSPDTPSGLNELTVFDNLLTFEDLEPNANINGFAYSPQAPVGEAQTFTIPENNPIVLQVQVGGAFNVYQWKKDGALIPGANEDTYIISSASVDDAGQYTLEITNEVVNNLTLSSHPITVNVIPVMEFEANLSPFHVVTPLLGPADGEVSASLVGSTLTVLGEFAQLQNEFGAAYLHLGAPGVATDPVFELAVTVNGASGIIAEAQNEFELSNDQILALQNGLFYISVETASGSIADPFAPELRVQLYPPPNAQPASTSITAPANGSTFDLNEAGEIDFTWNAVNDPDGDPVDYLWVFSRSQNFNTTPSNIEGLFRTNGQTTFTITHANLDAFLASQGVAQGESVTLYYLVASTDGSLFNTSAVSVISLTRSNNNQPPRVSNPIADFTYLLEDGTAQIDLSTVFQDPDGDDLIYSGSSSNENIAQLAINQAILTMTPIAPGTTTITLGAKDEFDAEATESFELTINSRPEILNEIQDFTLLETDDPFTRSLSTVFADQDPLNYDVISSNQTVADAAILADALTLQITPIAAGVTNITVTALDNQGGDNSITFQVTVQSDAIMPPLSVSENVSITFGNPELSSSYRLVALPGQVDIPLASAVNGTPDTDWIAYRDNGQDAADREMYFVEYDGSAAFSFKPGNGFWLLSKLTWQRSENRPTVPLDANQQYAISLQPGWNIISNPFDIDISWASVAEINGVSQQIYRWDGQYSTASVFSSASRGNAFYFFNSENFTSLKLPYLPATSANTTHPMPPALEIMATTQGDTLSLIRAGRHKLAETGLDALDQIAPPEFFESKGMRLYKKEKEIPGRQRYLSEEYLPENAPGYRYEIILQAQADTPLEIHVSGLSAFENHQEIFLFDSKLGKRYDLRKNPSLTFWPKSTKQEFVLLIGEDAYIEEQQADILPDEVVLLPSYPNPFNHTATIEFALPEPSRVRIVVYDTLGRQVSVLASGAYNAGHHQISWNGSSDAGAALGSGVYFYQIQLQEKQIVRSMILRR